MNDYRTKLGDNGRIVIPSNCRKLLHLVPGEDLVLRLEKNGLHLMSLKQSLKQAQAVIQNYAKKQNLTQKLRELRNEDD
jgi:AbrB family looped-hinge helix DNA binding protein